MTMMMIRMAMIIVTKKIAMTMMKMTIKMSGKNQISSILMLQFFNPAASPANVHLFHNNDEACDDDDDNHHDHHSS